MSEPSIKLPDQSHRKRLLARFILEWAVILGASLAGFLAVA